VRTIEFELVHPVLGPYNDTVIVADDMTDAEIEVLGNTRLETWAAGVLARSAVPSPDEENADGSPL
jgi:hypothetical protein